MKTLAGKTLVVAAGGTGGHVFPALAIAHWWLAEGGSVRWLGTARGLDARVVPQHGIPHVALAVTGLRGRGWRSRATALLNLGKSLVAAMGEMRRERPAVVLAMGGYASAPGALVAFIRRVPLVVHEQNSVAGLTNRWLARLAQRVLEGFPNSFPPSFGAVHVGNPVRAEFFALPAPAVRYGETATEFRVLVVGGSQGAQVFNTRVPEALGACQSAVPLVVRHQCGRGQEAAVAARYAALGIHAQVDEFIDRMADAQAWAHVVIGRAGAMTVAELTAVGVASILVPLPSAADDHQTGNARFLESAGGAIRLSESTLNAANLGALLTTLAADPARCLAMAERARALALPDTVARAGEFCREVAR